jgi:hypothetical protein
LRNLYALWSHTRFTLDSSSWVGFLNSRSDPTTQYSPHLPHIAFEPGATGRLLAFTASWVWAPQKGQVKREILAKVMVGLLIIRSLNTPAALASAPPA